MMGLTMAVWMALGELAGSGLTYPGCTGSGRPPHAASKPSARYGLLAFLIDAQGYVCPHCGGAYGPLTFSTSDLSHVYGSGPSRGGFIAGNIYAAHSGCNVAAARAGFEGEAIAHLRADKVQAYMMSLGEGAFTEANESGRRQVLGLGDFLRPDVIVTEWPVTAVTGFKRYDPRF